jgi:plasmid stabilization system protein ParE
MKNTSKFKILITPEAVSDVENASDWYELHAKGLGKRFYKEIKFHLKSLKNLSFGFQVRYSDVRCVTVKNFPFLIHYRILEESKTITIIAVFHTSQNPNIWEHRTE